MVSCFNLPFSGSIWPYLFTICAVASVKCLFIIGGDFPIGLFAFAYWISGVPYISWIWILCSLFELLISLWLAFLLYSFLFFSEQKFSILMQIYPSFFFFVASTFFPCLCCSDFQPPFLGRKLTQDKTCSGFWVYLSSFPSSCLVIPMSLLACWWFPGDCVFFIFFSCLSMKVGLSYIDGHYPIFCCCGMEGFGYYFLEAQQCIEKPVLSPYGCWKAERPFRVSSLPFCKQQKYLCLFFKLFTIFPIEKIDMQTYCNVDLGVHLFVWNVLLFFHVTDQILILQGQLAGLLLCGTSSSLSVGPCSTLRTQSTCPNASILPWSQSKLPYT